MSEPLRAPGSGPEAQAQALHAADDRDAQPPCEVESAPRPAALDAGDRALPMRWHGFLVRAMLFLTAALHALQAWGILSGWIYHGAQVRAAVYAGLPGMRALDAFFAGMLIVGAALQLAARFQLAARRARGVRRLTAAYGALLAGVAGYALGRLLLSGLSPLSPALMAQAGYYLGLLLVNVVYYRKRRGAFAPAKGEEV